MWTGTHIKNSRSGKEEIDYGWRVRVCRLFITWVLGVGQVRDGAALGWTDASPKRNHRISSTKEEKRGEERRFESRGGGS